MPHPGCPSIGKLEEMLWVQFLGHHLEFLLLGQVAVAAHHRPTPITIAWEGEEAASLGGACEPQQWIGEEEGVGIGEEEEWEWAAMGIWGGRGLDFLG
jgi:hypothetical protein